MVMDLFYHVLGRFTTPLTTRPFDAMMRRYEKHPHLPLSSGDNHPALPPRLGPVRGIAGLVGGSGRRLAFQLETKQLLVTTNMLQLIFVIIVAQIIIAVVFQKEVLAVLGWTFVSIFFVGWFYWIATSIV